MPTLASRRASASYDGAFVSVVLFVFAFRPRRCVLFLFSCVCVFLFSFYFVGVCVRVCLLVGVVRRGILSPLSSFAVCSPFVRAVALCFISFFCVCVGVPFAESSLFVKQ